MGNFDVLDEAPVQLPSMVGNPMFWQPLNLILKCADREASSGRVSLGRANRIRAAMGPMMCMTARLVRICLQPLMHPCLMMSVKGVWSPALPSTLREPLQVEWVRVQWAWEVLNLRREMVLRLNSCRTCRSREWVLLHVEWLVEIRSRTLWGLSLVSSVFPPMPLFRDIGMLSIRLESPNVRPMVLLGAVTFVKLPLTILVFDVAMIPIGWIALGVGRWWL